jgi:hypothetical protein
VGGERFLRSASGLSTLQQRNRSLRICPCQILINAKTGKVNFKFPITRAYRALPGWQAELGKESLQLRTLRFDFFQDGDVGVGIFPRA